MATFRTCIFSHQRRSDGTYNIKLRITHHRKSRWISTTLYAMPDDLTRGLKIKNEKINRKCREFAMRVYGNSMVPNYPAGCVIGLRQYNEHFIEPGTVYVIETEENRFLKRLYYNKDKKAFRCMSDNHMKHENGPMEGEYFYPEFEIPFEDIRRLLRVTGVIKRNIL